MNILILSFSALLDKKKDKAIIRIMEIEARPGETIHQTVRKAAKLALLTDERVQYTHEKTHDSMFPSDVMLLPLWQTIALALASHLPKVIRSRIEERYK